MNEKEKADELEQELAPLFKQLGEYVQLKEMAGGNVNLGVASIDDVMGVLTANIETKVKELEKLRGESAEELYEYLRSKYS